MTEYWIWLQEFVKGIGFKDKLALLEHFVEPVSAFRASFTELWTLGVPKDVYDSFFTEHALDQARTLLGLHERRGIRQLVRCDPEFRGGDWFVLYYKGRLASGPAVTVVGTRQCSAHGYYHTRQVCNHWVDKGFTVNSGLARGIDKQAHLATMEHGGRTQAFLAHGLDGCYPREHAGLMEEIVESGAVISPFFAGVRPLRHHFALRNALMCAWSDEVVVVEAPEKSGAMLTAEFARHLKKNVWTVEPGSKSERCSGNRKLLALGAKPCRMPDGSPLVDPVPDDALIGLLRKSPMSTDELSRALERPFTVLEERLLALSLVHWVVFSGDGRWHYNGW